MSEERRFIRLPPNWEDLTDDEIARLCSRAERLQGLLPDLPTLGGLSSGAAGSAHDDGADGGIRLERRPGRGGRDRETGIDQQDERAG